MWLELLTFLGQIQPRPEDQDHHIGKLILPLILFALYILSTLLKGKQQKKAPSRPPGRRQPRTLPPYARRVPSSSAPPRQTTGAPASRPSAAPVSRRPAPPRRQQPVPARARPISTTVSRPKTPVASRQPRPAPISVSRPVTPPIVAKRAGLIAPAQVSTPAAKKKIPLAKPTVEGRRAQVRQVEETRRVGEEITAAQLLGTSKLPKNQLARAIVYAEIIGKPLALRPSSSFEL